MTMPLKREDPAATLLRIENLFKHTGAAVKITGGFAEGAGFKGVGMGLGMAGSLGMAIGKTIEASLKRSFENLSRIGQYSGQGVMATQNLMIGNLMRDIKMSRELGDGFMRLSKATNKVEDALFPFYKEINKAANEIAIIGQKLTLAAVDFLKPVVGPLWDALKRDLNAMMEKSGIPGIKTLTKEEHEAALKKADKIMDNFVDVKYKYFLNTGFNEKLNEKVKASITNVERDDISREALRQVLTKNNIQLPQMIGEHQLEQEKIILDLTKKLIEEKKRLITLSAAEIKVLKEEALLKTKNLAAAKQQEAVNKALADAVEAKETARKAKEFRDSAALENLMFKGRPRGHLMKPMNPVEALIKEILVNEQGMPPGMRGGGGGLGAGGLGAGAGAGGQFNDAGAGGGGNTRLTRDERADLKRIERLKMELGVNAISRGEYAFKLQNDQNKPQNQQDPQEQARLADKINQADLKRMNLLDQLEQAKGSLSIHHRGHVGNHAMNGRPPKNNIFDKLPNVGGP